MVLFLTVLPSKLKPYINIFTDWAILGPTFSLWRGNRKNCMESQTREGRTCWGDQSKIHPILKGLISCTLRSLMLAALLRLPQTFATHCRSLCICWSGKDTAWSLQAPSHHSSSCEHGKQLHKEWCSAVVLTSEQEAATNSEGHEDRHLVLLQVLSAQPPLYLLPRIEGNRWTCLRGAMVRVKFL